MLIVTILYGFLFAEDVVVSHMNINLDICFLTKVLKGHVILTVLVKSENTQHLVIRTSYEFIKQPYRCLSSSLIDSFQILDTRDLHVSRVTCGNDEKDLEYSVGKPIHTFGSKLTIWLPKLTSEK